MIVGAGMIPVLIQAIENRLPNRLFLVSKTMQLLDNVLYGYTNAFTLFCNARGVEILVDRIEVSGFAAEIHSLLLTFHFSTK